MRKILIIGTEDSLFDSCLDLVDASLFNLLYSSDTDIAMYLITLFIPDLIFCSTNIDKTNYDAILNFLHNNPIIANVPVVQFTGIDISMFHSNYT